MPARIGVVLGAGGVVGGAWLAGTLAGIERETGWDPGSADFLLGTSAGAVMAGLLGGGVPARDLMPVSHARGRDWILRDLATARYPKLGPRAALGPGSPLTMLGFLGASGSWARLAAMLMAFAPRGRESTAAIARVVRTAVAAPPSGWPDHQACWIAATDYRTGRRVVFGRDHTADLSKAVCASCAIPGYYAPVEISGREYVDGGIASPTNADLAMARKLDLVLCLNPLGRRQSRSQLNPVARLESAVRSAASRQVEVEAARLRAAGASVEILEPGPKELDLMPIDAMDSAHSIEVGRAAADEARHRLRAWPAPVMRALVA